MEIDDCTVDGTDPHSGENFTSDPGVGNSALAGVYARSTANFSTHHPLHHSNKQAQIDNTGSGSGSSYVDRSSLRKWRAQVENRGTAQQKIEVEPTGITNSLHQSRQVEPQWVTNLLTVRQKKTVPDYCLTSFANRNGKTPSLNWENGISP